MSDMEPLRRKRSTSSESELSDGWSLLDSTDENNHSDNSCDTISTNLMNNNVEGTVNGVHNTQVSNEIDSDADSIEIIKEEQTDFLPVPENRIITYRYDGKQEMDKEEDNSVFDQHCPKVALIDHNHFLSRDWFQVVLVFSLIGLLVVVSSFVILFFQAQLLSFKSFDEAAVYNSDHEMSLLAQITYYKKEIQQLKNELRSLNQEANDWVRVDKEFHDNDMQTANEDGLETITEKPVASPIQNHQFPQLQQEFDNLDDSHLFNDPDFHLHQMKINQVVRLYSNISGIYTRNISNTSLLLNKIHSNVINLLVLTNNVKTLDKLGDQNAIINKIRRKLSNFFLKIEEDFHKVIAKMTNRSNKIHSDIMNKLCLITNNGILLENIDCSKQKQLKEKKDQNYIERKVLHENKKINYKSEKMFSEHLNNKRKRSPSDGKSKTKSEFLEVDSNDLLKNDNLKKLSKEEENHNLKEKSHDPHSQSTTVYQESKIDSVSSKRKKPSKKHVNNGSAVFNRDTKLPGVSTNSQKCIDKQTGQDCNTKKLPKLKKMYNKKKNSFEIDIKFDKSEKFPTQNGSVYKASSKTPKRESHNGGLWFLEMGELRARKRSDHHKSDWMFERQRGRNTLRNEAKWVFDRASMREFCRTNSQSYWCI